jgi:hypothetical protein
MAHTKNRPAAARSAADAATDPAPAPVTGPAADSPAGAVHAALAASPGATTAVIADAAGIGRKTARDALLDLQKAGAVTRVKGGKPGIPDTWTLAATGQADGEPGPDPRDEPDSQPGGEAEAVQGAEDDAAAEPATDPEADSGDGPATEPAQENQPGAGNSAGERGDASEQEHEAVPGDDAAPDTGAPPGDEATPSGGAGPEEDVPQDEDAAPAGGGEAGDEPDPALVAEVSGCIGQIKAAADAAAIVLTAGGDLRAALAGLDEACEQAAQARRALKAAIGGRKAPASRPGALRERVLAHLDAHPEGEFTPHEIHKVLGNSSGAIANALDTLVTKGEAELATEKPRRFRRAAGKATPAAPETDAVGETGDAGGAADDSTVLEGAA